MKQIVEYLKELIGNVRTEYAPPRLRDYRETVVSIEKVKRKLRDYSSSRREPSRRQS